MRISISACYSQSSTAFVQSKKSMKKPAAATQTVPEPVRSELPAPGPLKLTNVEKNHEEKFRQLPIDARPDVGAVTGQHGYQKELPEGKVCIRVSAPIRV
jgi:hypothetical protein